MVSINGRMVTPLQARTEFWEQDKAEGGLIYDQYTEIKRVLSNADREWVKERYREIKAHAIKNTPFYSSFSPDDTFPVVTKADILENYEAHKAVGDFLTPTHISSTSGSTGVPFSVIQDLKKRKRTIADLKVLGELCDYPSHERMVMFRVLSDKLKRTPEQEARENIYYIDSSGLDSVSLDRMTDRIFELKPRIVFSYASTLVALADRIRSRGIPAEEFSSVRSVLTAGEGIFEENRQKVSEVFGCPVYRRYADMELGILGQDRGDGGCYHLNWGSFYFECLKPGSDEPAEYGETGRIVITDLFNYAMPMIRYDTGDLGIMQRDGADGFPYFTEIHGRSRDCVYTTAGEIISPAKISVSMWGVESVKQWQFVQKGQREYLLRLNADKNADTSGILKKMRGALGEDALIDIEYVDEIPVLSSNKRRAVICEWKKQ